MVLCQYAMSEHDKQRWMRDSMSSGKCVTVYRTMRFMTSLEGDSPMHFGCAEQLRLEIGGDW